MSVFVGVVIFRLELVSIRARPNCWKLPFVHQGFTKARLPDLSDLAWIARLGVRCSARSLLARWRLGAGGGPGSAAERAREGRRQRGVPQLRGTLWAAPMARIAT